MNKPVAVTGIGLLTSLGIGTSVNGERMQLGHSGVARIRRFCPNGLPTTIAASVDFLDIAGDARPDERAIRMGNLVVDEALERAGIASRNRFDGAFFIAPPIHDTHWPEILRLVRESNNPTYAAVYAQLLEGRGHFAGSNQTIALYYARRHTLARLPLSTTTACASGASTIQFAVESIGRGECRRALVLGIDCSVRPEVVVRFSLLSALSTANDPPERASKPFSKDRDGFVMGEGAAALVLEDPDEARARGAKILAYIVGIGESGDSYHRTRSHPDGHSIVKCMKDALAEANLKPSDVSVIHAHGTSTPDNDKTEGLAIRNLFGAHASHIPVTSIKSMIGHTLAAAGAVGAVCTTMNVATGVVPPTINHAIPDPDIDINVVGNVARNVDARVVLSNSLGFGGQNICLAFARP